jgi:hypothetical protein
VVRNFPEYSISRPLATRERGSFEDAEDAEERRENKKRIRALSASFSSVPFAASSERNERA